jgi:RNA polymerase sigma-70 factor (ECF subfamily)
VFLNAFLKMGSYDPQFRFFSWIYRMAVNESLNVLRRRRQTVTLEDFPVTGDLADRETEMQDQVGKGLMGLKPDDRAVLVLKHFVFFSYEEIAEVLEVPVKTVKSRLFTARERLRLALGEPGA